MKKLVSIAVCSFTILCACTSPVTKKVLIIGRGTIAANENNITMKEGSGYAEETREVTGDKAVTWNVETPATKTTINIPEEKGFYILNLRADTLVGSRQMLGTDLGSRTMSQEELRSKIDSLVKLTTGSNVSKGGSSFFVLPNQLIKVSGSMDARVFGPFTKIPSSIEADKEGNAPEIYKFYTNTEMRDLIGNLKKLTY